MLGVPSIGMPFAIQVKGRPGANGWLTLSQDSIPTFLPTYGAIIHTQPLARLVPFILGPDGISPPLLDFSKVVPELCGRTFFAQAVVVDMNAQGSLAFTKAARFGFGSSGAGNILGSPSRYAGAYNFQEGALEDVDGDQIADLVVDGMADSGNTNGVVRFFPGLGDGTFASPVHFPASGRTQGIAVEDFNGDRFPDIATTLWTGSGAVIFYGDGTGSFSAPVNYPIGPWGRKIYSGDLNGDQLPDLLAVTGYTRDPKALSILLGTGNGTFLPVVQYDVGVNPHSLALVDMNRDGILDVALSVAGSVAQGTPAVSVLLGSGDGTLGSPTFYPLPTTFPQHVQNASIASADLNGDGIQDLMEARFDPNKFEGSVAVFLGVGDGTLGPPTSFSLNGKPIGNLVLTDLDGDRIPDLLTSPYTIASNRVDVLLGNGDGSFRNGPSQEFIAPLPRVSVVGDIDGDHLPDFVCIDFDFALVWTNELLR